MDIRFERRDDHEDIRDLHLAAFGDHGRVVNTLVDELRATLTPEKGLSLVAAEDDAVIGHVMFTTSRLDAPRRLVDVAVLSPVGVLPEEQGKGIGSGLIRTGLEMLGERDLPLVFLEGPSTYYSRLGFRAASQHGFRKPSLRIPDGSFQVFHLRSYEPWMTGTLVYSEAFWNCDAVGLRGD